MREFDFGYLGATILTYTFYGLIAGFMIYFAIGFFSMRRCVKPNLIEPRLSEIKQWWLDLGGYL